MKSLAFTSKEYHFRETVVLKLSRIYVGLKMRTFKQDFCEYWLSRIMYFLNLSVELERDCQFSKLPSLELILT